MGAGRRHAGWGSDRNTRSEPEWLGRLSFSNHIPLRCNVVASKRLSDPLEIYWPSDPIRYALPIYPVRDIRSEQRILPDPNRYAAINLNCGVSFRSEPESYNLKYSSMVGFLTLCCLVHKVG